MQEVGWAGLGIIPTFDKFGSNLERGTSKAMVAAGVSGGDAFGDSAGKAAGSKFRSHIKSAAKIAAVGLAGAAAAAIKFGGDALEEAREAQKVGALTESTIKATGQAAKVTAQQVSDLAGAISEKSGIDDEAIQRGANLILTFKGIRNEAGKGNKIYNRATKSVTDMAAAMAGGSGGEIDLKSASIQVGKALNDPIKGMAALNRVGVTFTDQQKAMVTALQKGGVTEALNAMGFSVKADEFTKKMDEMGWGVMRTVGFFTGGLDKMQRKRYEFLSEGGHMVDAQKVILDELASEFGGAAAAQATEADKLKVAWGNFKEEIGTQLIPVMDDLATFLRRKGIPAAQDFVGWFRDEGVPAIKDFADEMKPVIEGAKDLAGYLNDLPKSVKIGVPAGLAALLGYGKLRGGNLGGGGGALGSLGKAAGLAKPVPVYVVNKGFGADGGGLPDGKPKGKPKIPGTPIPLAAVPYLAPLATTGDRGPYKYDRKGQNAVKYLGDQLGLDRSGVGLDDALSNLVKQEPDKAFKIISHAAKMAGEDVKNYLNMDDALPKSVAAVDAAERKFGSFKKAGDGVADGARRLAVEIFGVTKEIRRAADAANRYSSILDGIPEEVKTHFVQTITKKNDIGEKGDPRFGGFRANGGSAERGKAYIVGERRPEVFVPNTPGRIEPRVGGGSDRHYHFHGVQDLNAARREVQHAERAEAIGAFDFR